MEFEDIVYFGAACEEEIEVKVIGEFRVGFLEMGGVCIQRENHNLILRDLRCQVPLFW